MVIINAYEDNTYEDSYATSTKCALYNIQYSSFNPSSGHQKLNFRVYYAILPYHIQQCVELACTFLPVPSQQPDYQRERQYQYE